MSKEWVGKPWSNDVPPPSIEQRRSDKPGRRWTRVSWLGGRVVLRSIVRCQVPGRGGRRPAARGREQATGDGQAKMYPKSGKIGTNADMPMSIDLCHHRGAPICLSPVSDLATPTLRSKIPCSKTRLRIIKRTQVSSKSKERKSTKSGGSYMYHASLLPLRFQERAEQGRVVG